MKSVTTARRGVAAVETALVLSVLLVLMYGMLAGGTGVFRQQQVQCLACEGARWASVHGGEYLRDNDGATSTSQDVINQAVLTKAVGMNPADITVKVEWVDRSTNTPYDWDVAPKDTRSVTALGEYISNTVRVTVSYKWSPGTLWGQTTITCVSELPLSN